MVPRLASWYGWRNLGPNITALPVFEVHRVGSSGSAIEPYGISILICLYLALFVSLRRYCAKPWFESVLDAPRICAQMETSLALLPLWRLAPPGSLRQATEGPGVKGRKLPKPKSRNGGVGRSLVWGGRVGVGRPGPVPGGRDGGHCVIAADPASGKDLFAGP